MATKFIISFDEVENDWCLSATFPDVDEASMVSYEQAIRSLIGYLSALIEADTGRAGAVTLTIEDTPSE